MDQAIAAYRRAIDIDPKVAFAHANLGFALKAKGKLNEAITAYRKAIELAPNVPGAYNELAWLLVTCSDAKLRNPKQAVALAKKAVEYAPNNGSYVHTLGVALYRAHDYKAGIAAVEKAMAFNKGGTSFDWFFLAMARWQLGEKDKARECYHRAGAVDGQRTRRMMRSCTAFGQKPRSCWS